tara:strand:+ start:465 stop:953 length:489 start_codon:yes stop_codon:yes gene_type:complete
MGTTLNGLNKGTFLAILLVSGNYLGELLPCEIQQNMHNNRITKYTILLFSMWYFISGTGAQEDILHLLSAFVLVLLLTKTHFRCFMTVIVLLFIGDVLTKTGYRDTSSVCNVCALVVLCGGFLVYTRAKQIEYGGDGFSWRRFWFKNECLNNGDGKIHVWNN